MSANQRKAGIVLGYVNIVVKNLVNLVYTPMLLAFVGQADYGVYQSSNSFVFSLSILSLGFSGAYLRFYTQRKEADDDEGVRRLNGVYLIFYAVVSAVAVALGLCFAASANIIFSSGFTSDQVELARVLMDIMSFSVASTLFNNVFDSYIVAHERFTFQQTRSLFTTLATPFIAYALLCVGLGPVGVAIAQLVVNLSLLALNARYAIGDLGMQFDVQTYESGLFRAVAVFSGWLLANQVCDLIGQNVPNVMLGALSSATAVAVFAVACQIRNVFTSLSVAISSVFAPQVNVLVARRVPDEELTRLMTRVGRVQMIIYCWVLGGFAFLGKFFIGAWAGEGFADAYWLVLMMVIPLAAPLSQNVGIDIQKAKNMHKARSVVYLLINLGNVVFTLFFAGSLGSWAAAIGYSLSILFGNTLWMNWYYHNHVGLDMGYFWRRTTPVVLAGLLSVALFLLVTHFVPVSSWLGFVGWGLAYTVVYGLILLFLVCDDVEREMVFGKLKGLRRQNA